MRKILLTLLATVTTSLFAAAIGEWQAFPAYYYASKNIAAGNVIYALTKNMVDKNAANNANFLGNLMSYNTEDSEVRLFNNVNSLSGVGITNIIYSKEAHTLAIIYKDNNIDLLDDNGNVYNLPSLRDKIIANKDIADIYVYGKMLYLATGFGIVEVDMDEGVFCNTYRLGLSANSIMVNETDVYLSTTEGMYRCSKQKDMHMKENWKYSKIKPEVTLDSEGNIKSKADSTASKMLWFDNKIYTLTSSGIGYIDQNDSIRYIHKGTFPFLREVNGELIWAYSTKVYLQAPGKSFRGIDINNAWSDVSYANGTYWVSDRENGLKGYKIKDNKFELAASSIQPNSPKYDLSYRMNWVGNRLLVAGGINTTDATYYEPTAMMYEDGKWTNFEEFLNPDAKEYPKLRLANTTNIIQDPNDPDHHFASLHRNGICEYRNGKFVKLYNCNNSPLPSILPLNSSKLNYVACAGLKYDSEGNMWMLSSQNDTIVRVWKNDGKWAALYYDEIKGSSLCDNILTHSSGLMALNSRWTPNNSGQKGFFFFDHNGTIDNVRDDRHKLITTIVNQDETYYNPQYYYAMAEDFEGRIWCGTSEGLFVIDDPSTIFDKDFRFTQVKINREDGSGLADYLLNGVSVTCISVDGANRKWIGTESNGVFLISADGQEMIHHFTAEESPLVSNNIYDIAPNPINGDVMIGTSKGLCCYTSDATEAADGLDKENIEVFPNPVTSDYTGPIIMRGLPFDCEIKIVSTGGLLVWSGRSTGGQFTWNGIGKGGSRVASGIYHVIANTSDGSKAIVTRIAIIK